MRILCYTECGELQRCTKSICKYRAFSGTPGVSVRALFTLGSNDRDEVKRDPAGKGVFMQLIGETIRHVQFGRGVVTACDHNIITVDFPTGVKRFVYPDAFEQFLVPKDTETKEEINGILVEQKLEEKMRHQQNLEHQRKLAHLRAIKIPPVSQVVYDLDNQEGNDPFTSGCCITGTYLSGYSKGEPRVPQRVNFNTMNILTRCPRGKTEHQREVVALAMTAEGFCGERCTDGRVPFHGEFRLKLLQPLALWPYAEKEPQKAWGRSTFKYLSNRAGEEILRDVCRQFAGTDREELAGRFLRYYCECNRLPVR